MSGAVHAAASHNLPGFITAPGETDVLMGISLVMLLAIVFGIGILYFKLHALPEQIAHKTDKVQFQIVAVLSLIALFTHDNIYWIAALLLALVRLPDFSTPLAGIAGSLAKIADSKTPRPKAKPAPEPPADGKKKPAGGVKSKDTGDA